VRARTTLLAILLWTATADADLPRCSDAPVGLGYYSTDVAEQSGDTGWIPDGSPAQLRLTGAIVGHTNVAMTVQPSACWTDGHMTITVPGVAQSGLLDSEYGAEVHLYGQVHTSVLGYAIDWSSEIPIPFIPHDLVLGGTTTFDPVVLADSPQPVVQIVSAPTSPIVVLSTNLLDAIIAITGISGSLDVDVQGGMTTAYTTSSIAVGDGTITSVADTVTVAAPGDGFGDTLAASISASGVVHYEPSLIFSLRFAVRILGVKIVNYDLADISVALPTIDRAVVLTGSDLAIPLPRLDPIPTALGFATGLTQQLQLHNAGSAPLAIEVSSAPDGVSADAMTTIAPGADGTVTVVATDRDALGSAPLVLATNDPGHPTLSIALEASHDGEVTTSGSGDPSGPSSKHSSGCAARHGDPLFGLALALVVALAMMRRRNA
jgi:hypothetical protein